MDKCQKTKYRGKTPPDGAGERQVGGGKNLISI